MKTSYLTIQGVTETLYVEKASKFIAYSQGEINLDTAKLFIQKIRSEHPKASHHCYAYRLGLDSNHFRCEDDGEPSGTAGKPILRQIDSFGLSDTILVVVRYFGGTLLGTAGLIKAYKFASMEVLKQSVIIEKQIRNSYQISAPAEQMYKILNIVKQMDIPYSKLIIDHVSNLQIDVPLMHEVSLFGKIKTKIENVDLTNDVDLFEIENCKIVKIIE